MVKVTVFGAGQHEIKVWRHQGRWGVSVDGSVSRHWFGTEAQAAGAGLLRAHRLDLARKREEGRRAPASLLMRPTG